MRMILVRGLYMSVFYNILADTSVFPHMPGSHLTMHSPALQFTKFITHVLALHSAVEQTAVKVKRNLLKYVFILNYMQIHLYSRILQLSEFSDEADFIDPCLSYVLAEVACAACGSIGDLDVCRDVILDAQHGTW